MPDREEARQAALRQLACDLNCAPEDLLREGIHFFEARENPGRRPFPRGNPHFEMLTTGSGVVVSASETLLPGLRAQLDGQSRDEAFSMPFVYGQALYYLPDPQRISACVKEARDIEIELVEDRRAIRRLYDVPGFRNAIQYDESHPRPDRLVTLVRAEGEIVGMAGASEDCEMLWQIGIDVLPSFRRRGIATALVSRLASEVLLRGRVPYYGTASCNTASQRVAAGSGFVPGWTCVYRGRFDGACTMPTG